LNKKTLMVLGLLGFACLPALADVTVLAAVEPTQQTEGITISRARLEANIGKALGQAVSVTITDDLTDAMRSTRSAGYDVFIAPAQVAASALSHGYTLLGSTDAEEQFLLIGRNGLTAAGQLRKARLYLPQQDSIYTYVARGMLTASGLSFKDLGKVEFARYPQAGLTAILMHASDATVVQRADWEVWQKSNAGVALVLATSGAVPGGLSVTLKKDMAPKVKLQLAQWFASATASAGMKALGQHAELSTYKRLAELGTFTPPGLPGTTLVQASDIQSLVSGGAVLVDTRTEQEFNQKRILSARFAPYHEKSLKDIAYDASLDDFSALKTLNSKTPTIFYCNGAECWKSYKASRAALAAGFTKVYWYRTGLPDWEAHGQKSAEN
jgi:rhodanese-related sulfurtransferase